MTVDLVHPEHVVSTLRDAQLRPGGLLAAAMQPGVGLGLAVADRPFALATDDPLAAIELIQREFRPRWVWWSSAETAAPMVAAGVRPGACWDVFAVHRLLVGGWRVDIARIWAWLHDLDPTTIPALGQLDLLGTMSDGDGGDRSDPVRPDGHLRPEWIGGAYGDSPTNLGRWAAAALRASSLQMQRLAQLEVGGDPMATARAESTAELLCTELAHDGLPIDVMVVESIIAASVGPRPRSNADESVARADRDAVVLSHLPPGSGIDLRNPADVKALLRRIGVEVPDTRAWRLEAMRDVHPVIDALLVWRKAERTATTFGYRWLDEHVGTDGRLRGAWTACDGSAGRMTAQAGLHNLPAELRPAVEAEAGHVFVRADLGQIEPRVLAAVSGDRALVQAARADDLYLPVAVRLGVERPVAKIAMLAAMYGQTSGSAGRALQGMERSYPVAMQFLRDAARAGERREELRTFGGRRVPMDTGDTDTTGNDADTGNTGNTARGRYARNAMVQGAAAELFKAWAITVRARTSELGARIVLCLHDELLVHVPEARAEEAAAAVDACLTEASDRWFGGAVRFVSDTGIVRSWAESKPPSA